VSRDDNIQTFAAMFDGYALSIERFERASKERSSTPSFIALFEALNWAVALDDRARKHWTPEGKPLGFGWRERVRNADVMGGVRFARNSVHHQWSEALSRDESGLTFPVTFPMVFFEWRWRAASELPEPERPDKHHAENEAIYREKLEGQPARLTLDTLAEAFYFLRQVLEPTTLPRRASQTPTIEAE
jgi:hypothetical protein